jgi:hypothetical protein
MWEMQQRGGVGSEEDGGQGEEEAYLDEIQAV